MYYKPYPKEGLTNGPEWQQNAALARTRHSSPYDVGSSTLPRLLLFRIVWASRAAFAKLQGAPLLNGAALRFDAFCSSGRRPRFWYRSRYPSFPVCAIKHVQLLLKKTDRGGRTSFPPTWTFSQWNISGVPLLPISVPTLVSQWNIHMDMCAI
jgi:hypothetical protein